MHAPGRVSYRFRILVTSCAALLLVWSGPTAAMGDPVPDFALPDVNPTSDRFGELVSPRDYLGGVSAWYFGRST